MYPETAKPQFGHMRLLWANVALYPLGARMHGLCRVRRGYGPYLP